MSDLAPGTVVSGPFYSDEDDYDTPNRFRGIGVIMKRTNRFPYNVGDDYVPVKIIRGDRCPGGYNAESLTPIPNLKAV